VPPVSGEDGDAETSRSSRRAPCTRRCLGDREPGASRRREPTGGSMRIWCSVSLTILAIMATAWKGYFPAAVSPESMTASVPS